MPPGGDPAFLIFGSFDQAKERTRKTNTSFIDIKSKGFEEDSSL